MSKLPNYDAPPGVGPTGQYPDAKIGQNDGGELTIGVAADPRRGLVVIHFGTSVNWVATPPDKARGFAAMILAKCAELDGGPAS